MSTATWFTGRRRAVRASIYAVSAICTIVCAVGLAFGHVALAWRSSAGAPTEPLLTHGGAVGLVGLAVVAALTIYGWRAELAGALAASGSVGPGAGRGRPRMARRARDPLRRRRRAGGTWRRWAW